jgi:hypothetical protein
MTDDGKFEAFLQREAREFNRPPADAPREEMWEVIARARAASRPVAGVSPIMMRPARRPLRYAPWIGMAATLLIGVGIGRYALRSAADPGAGNDSAMVAVASPATQATSTDAPAPGDAVAAASSVLDVPRPQGLPVRTASANSATSSASPRGGSRAAPRPVNDNAIYSVASQQHLSRAEALVAVVAAMPADAMMDSLTGRWARDVLTNTRLLLDSPAGDDPVRRKLLEDLETVLVQMVQRSGRTAEDRSMIDRTLERTQLLTRLRSGATGT